MIKQEIYKDGFFLADVSGLNSFVVEESEVSQVVDYQMISTYSALDTLQSSAVTEIAPSEIKHVDIKSALVHPSGILPGGLSAEAATATTSMLRYRTFISDAWVDAPPLFVCSPAGKDYVFKGDDRSYGPTFSSYRSSQDITVYWNSNGALALSKDVGTTKRYTKSGTTYTLDASQTASDSTLTLGITSQSSTFVNFHIAGDVRNPFCQPALTNGIYYSYQVHLYRSGSYTVTGSALAVPNHELSIRDDSAGGWTPIFKRANVSFSCLIPGWGGITCTNGTDYTGIW
jgi:hypothetical protein